MMYSVDAEKDRDPDKNILSITTILKNRDVRKKPNKAIEDGEIF